VGLMDLVSLFGAQRRHRVHLNGATSGQTAGEKSDGEEEERGGAKVIGSAALMSNNRLLNTRANPSAATSPASTPTDASPVASLITIAKCRRCAPKVIRIPISGLRCATEFDNHPADTVLKSRSLMVLNGYDRSMPPET
jgi:hypothetical protein